VKGRLLIGVIGSLGVRHDEKAVAPLLGLLKDSDAAVAQAAARRWDASAMPKPPRDFRRR
jgi:HEAT repeat protein